MTASHHEEFIPLDNYPGYSVTRTGIVRSDARVIVMKNGIKKTLPERIKSVRKHNGYLIVDLFHENIQRTIGVHQLVAQVFIPNPNNLPMINHKDENPANNCADNLEWCTCKHNINYGSRCEKYQESRRNHGKPIVKIAKSGVPVKEFRNLAEATDSIERSNRQHIWRALNNVCPTAYGFIWKYKAS